MATLIYDVRNTNPDEILKRIALAGYDSDTFLAPDDAYAKLPECCQYERVKKSELVKVEVTQDHFKHNAMTNLTTEARQETNQLKAVFTTTLHLKMLW